MPENNVYKVMELNEKLQQLVNAEPWLNNVVVEGELTGIHRDKRGHMYFSLKDPGSLLSAVMFAGKQRYGLTFAPENGDKVHAYGHVDVFVRDGKYQLYADRLVRVGAGEVNARLERLIARLSAMGLFSEEYKKPVPAYPRHIGIVTAGDKAAISDIKAVAARRDPYAQLYCYPATVQGKYAAADISRGIELLDAMGLDVIIVGRGGGSKEDLWAFNEEQVAWAIFNAETPIISATGHEIDTTVADMVADRRESNPSTAVMHALPVVSETVAEFDGALRYMTSVMRGRLQGADRTLTGYERQLRLLSPQSKAERQRGRLEEFEMRLKEAAPSGKISVMMDLLDKAHSDMDSFLALKLERRRHELEVLTARIHGLSPTAKLINGFGYISSDSGAVRSAHGVAEGDGIEITVHDGRIKAVVESVADLEG